MSQLSRTLDPMNIGLSEPARKTQLINVNGLKNDVPVVNVN